MPFCIFVEFIEKDDYVCMEVEHFPRKINGKEGVWMSPTLYLNVEGLRYSLSINRGSGQELNVNGLYAGKLGE